MSQQQNELMLNTRIEPRAEEEFSILLPNFSSVTGNAITLVRTLADFSIADHELAGQSLLVLMDFAMRSEYAGEVLHIIDNVAAVITVEEVLEGANRWTKYAYDFGDSGAGAVVERVAAGQRGVAPGHRVLWAANLKADGTYSAAVNQFELYTLKDLIAAIDSMTPPDPKNEWGEMFVLGSPANPVRHQMVRNGVTYDSSLPMSLLIGKHLMWAFGWVADGGSAWDVADPAQALTCDVYPGEMVLEVANNAGFSVGDLVEVSHRVNAAAAVVDGECRRVVAKDGANLIAVDRPFRRTHTVALTDTVHEVSATCYDYTNATAMASANYMTHILQVGQGYGYTVPTFCMGVLRRGNLTNPNVEDTFFTYRGLICGDWSFRSGTGEEAKSELSIKGLYADRDELTAPTLDTDLYYDNADVPLKPYHFSRSYVQFNGITWNYNEEVGFGVTRDIETKKMHFYGSVETGLVGGIHPTIHAQGRVTPKCNFSVPYHNQQLWDILQSGATIDITSVFSIIRSATFTEVMTVTAQNMPIEEGALEMSGAASTNQSISGIPDNLYITFQDKVRYF